MTYNELLSLTREFYFRNVCAYDMLNILINNLHCVFNVPTGEEELRNIDTICYDIIWEGTQERY